MAFRAESSLSYCVGEPPDSGNALGAEGHVYPAECRAARLALWQQLDSERPVAPHWACRQYLEIMSEMRSAFKMFLRLFLGKLKLSCEGLAGEGCAHVQGWHTSISKTA